MNAIRKNKIKKSMLKNIYEKIVACESMEKLYSNTVELKLIWANLLAVKKETI